MSPGASASVVVVSSEVAYPPSLNVGYARQMVQTAALAFGAGVYVTPSIAALEGCATGMTWKDSMRIALVQLGRMQTVSSAMQRKIDSLEAVSANGFAVAVAGRTGAAYVLEWRPSAVLVAD